MDTLNVFVSSTWIDMVPERQAVELATARLRSIRFVGMEHFGARDGTTRQVSLDEVDRCQVYAGVIGPRWGSGITEAEYRRARQRGLPCLLYFKGDTAPDDERLVAWKSELAAAHTVVTFASPDELAARLVADLHNLVLDRVAGHALDALPLEYRTRIEAFVAEYLGRADAPVAFGGRDAELDALDNWLGDANAPPYAMLAAPAGRGKSALLVRWVRQLAMSSDLAVLFFPVSIRFRTNLAAIAFTAITSRLAQLHGEPVRAGPNTPVEVWRELMAGLLRRPLPDGRRLLLVLDGADEAADWTLGPDVFPAASTERLRVLVSARYQPGDSDARGWVARLGWQRPGLAWPIDLGPLSAAGLADVLRQASVPLELLSERADIVAELFRLSRGDPLLIQLYVADLMRRGDDAVQLRPDDLGRREPGLSGYFAAWWEDQRVLWGTDSPLREAEFSQVFNVLSCALGPLRGRDLLELLSADRPIVAWAVDDVMRSLRRFVVGDGEVQGYAFSHPRLAEFFFDELQRLGQSEEVEARFVSWGRQWLADLASGRREPQAVPAYLLQFLRPHLQRARCGVEDLAALASSGWARAWERLDKGSWSGFLVDLQGARDAARADSDARVAHGLASLYLGLELRAAVFAASVAARAGELPAALLAVLIERGLWRTEQAIAYATRVPDDAARLEALLTVVAMAGHADRPLALAAALGQVRAMLADGTWWELSQCLGRYADMDGGAPDRPLSAALLGAAARLVRQGLDEDQAAGLADQLVAALKSSRAPPESRVLAIDAVAQVLVRPDLDPLRIEVLRMVAADVDEGRSAHAPVAFAHLTAALDDEPALTQPTLGAALLVLVQKIVELGQVDEAASDLLLAAVPMASDGARRAAGAALAPSASLPGFTVLLDALSARQIPGAQALLDALLSNAPVSCRPAIARARVRAGSAAAPSGVQPPRVFPPELLAAMTETEALAWFTAASATMGERVAWPDDFEWLLDAAHAHNGRAWRRAVALRALELGAVCGAQGYGVDDVRVAEAVLAAVVDALQAPGTGNAFEAWREPWTIRWGRASSFEVLGLVRSLLARGELSAQDLELAMERLCACPALQLVLADDPELRQRVAMGRSSPRETAELSASSIKLIAAHRKDPLDAVDLAQQALAAGGAITSALTLLGELVPGLGRPLVSAAVGALFDIDRTSHPMSLLQAKGTERVICNDVVNDALLLRALTHPPPAELDPRGWALLPLDVARLPAPSDELLALAIATVAKREDPKHGQNEDTLCMLAPLVPTRLRTRLLDAAAQGGEDAFRAALQALWRHTPDRTSFVSGLLTMAARLVSPAARLWSLDEAVLRAGDTIDIDAALALARALPDAAMRLQALHLLLPLLPPEREAPVLHDALELCVRTNDAGSFASDLVARVAGRRAGDAALVEAAVRAALTTAGRSARGQALAVLAPCLPDAMLADAVAAAQRLDDAPVCVRTMRAFAPQGGSAAATSLQQYVQALPDGPVQKGACLYASPLAPRPQRWSWVADALEGLDDPRSGFDVVELIDALAEALVDAPSSLQGQALERLRIVGAGARADSTSAGLATKRGVCDACTRAIEAWMPTLATHWWPCALVQIAEWPLAGSADRVAELWNARDIANARAGGTLTAAAIALLARVERLQGTCKTEAAPAFSVPRTAADLGGDDVARAGCLALWTQTEAPTPQQRLAMASLARRIGDPVLRAVSVRRLAAHADDAWIARSARAADALAALQPPGDAARRLVRLARRQASRQRERSFDAAEACLAAELDPGRRALAAVELVLASPLRLGWLLADVLPAAEEDTRVAALSRLLAEGDDADVADTLAFAALRLAEHRLLPMLRCAAISRTFGPAASAALLERAGATACGAWRGALVALAVDGLAAEGASGLAWSVASTIESDHGWLEAAAAITRRWPETFVRERAVDAAARLAALDHPDSTLRLLQTLLAAWPADALAVCVPALLALREEAMRAAGLVAAFDAAASRVTDRTELEPLLALARALGGAQLRGITLGRAARCTQDKRLLAEAVREADRSPHARLRLQVWMSVGADWAPLPEPLWERLLDELDLQPMATLQACVQLASGIDAGQAAALFDALPLPRLKAQAQDLSDVLAVLLPRLAPTERASAILRLPEACPGLAAVRCLGALGSAIEGDACEEASLQAARALCGASMTTAALLAIFDRLGPARQERVLDWLFDTPHVAEQARRLGAVEPCLHPQSRLRWQSLVDAIAEPALVGELLAAPRAEADGGPDAAAVARQADDAIGELLDELQPEASAEQDRAPAGWLGAPAHDLDALIDRMRRLGPEVDRVEQIWRSLPALGTDDRLKLIDMLHELFGPAAAERLRCQLAATLPSERLGRLVEETAQLAPTEGFGYRLQRVPGLLDPSFRALWLTALRSAIDEASQGQDRESLLAACRRWAPVMMAVGGEAAAREMVQAVSDAGHLWP